MRFLIIIAILLVIFMNIIFKSGALELKSANDEIYGNDIIRERGYFSWDGNKLENYLKIKWHDFFYGLKQLKGAIKK